MQLGGLAGRARGLCDRLFRERQIFLRTGTEVRFATLSKRSQIAAAALFGALLVWSAYASVVYFSYDARFAASEARFFKARAAYERAVTERDTAVAATRESYRNFLSALSHPFELLGDARIESEQELVTLRGRNAKLALDIAELKRELEHSRDERARLAENDAALTGRYDAIERELAEVKHRNGVLDSNVAGLERDLAAEKTRERAARQESAALGEALTESKGEIADARHRNDIASTRIATLEQTLASVSGERDKVTQDRSDLNHHVDELEQRLASLQSDQNALIARLSERATNRSIAVERAITMTGLDVDKLLGKTSADDWSTHGAKTGVGGPFVAYRPEKAATGRGTARSTEIELVVSSLDKQEERREGLNRILAHLPLASPIDGYRVMSDFGKRIDPINGRLGMHEGVDLTSEPGAPVLATAPGIVVFASWNGTYGKMVEVDHGMGIHTRYAHLKSIVVEVGRKVVARTELGIIGSTGRSTGTHVHYEVLVDDKHYDPAKFIRAGEYVFSKN